MKKLVLTLLCLFALTISVSAEDSAIVIVNGKLLETEVGVEIVENRTFVPLRAIAEELGAEIEWNAEARSISLKRDGIETALAIGSLSAAVKSGDKLTSVSLDAPPYISGGRTFVPLRFIAVGLGGRAAWCDELKAAVVTESTSRAQGAFGELLEAYIKIDLPTAIKADNALLAKDIADNPESVEAYFANLWFDRAAEYLADDLTESEKAECARLSDNSKKLTQFLEAAAKERGLPSPAECPIKMCAVTNNGISAIVVDAPTARTAEIAPQCAFLGVDGAVVSVRL